MRLVQQWEQIERGLPAGWSEARLLFRTESADALPRAAALLGPAGAGHVDDALVFTVRTGGYPSPEHVRRLLDRVDDARLWGSLELRDSAVAAPAAAAAGGGGADAEPTAVESWAAALGELPPDWSDLLCRVELESSALVPRAALLCAPMNPSREAGVNGFFFRCARRKGYGVSPEMTEACLARLDAEGLVARLSIDRVLSETRNVATQGPVWYVAGKVR